MISYQKNHSKIGAPTYQHYRKYVSDSEQSIFMLTGQEAHNHAGPAIVSYVASVALLAIAATTAIISTKKTSQCNWIATALDTVVILFVIIAGFAHANTSNLTPFFAKRSQRDLPSSCYLYFAYGGFNNIATMAEETKTHQETYH
ncbi:hypothetical protein CRYUN_Cryun04dG0001700 [Craigia yunnanensis]